MEGVIDDDFGHQEDLGKYVTYAGFWIRVGASVIDFLVMIPVVGFMFYNYMTIKSLILGVLMISLSSLYKPLMEAYYGATLGKMATGIKVVNLDYEPININTSIKRYAPWILTQVISLYGVFELLGNPAFMEVTDFIAITQLQNESLSGSLSQVASIVVVISALALLFNDEKQALHDQFAETYCIYKN